jgi:hypothetical protein
MLNELKVAAQWNRERLGGRVTDKQLVDMATIAPAHIAGVDDEVGAIRVGLRADLLIINGDHNNPYASVINASAGDVELVFINGVPLYGDKNLMKDFWNKSDLEEVQIADVTKTLANTAANIVIANIEQRLQLALQAEGVSLAPLVEADDFVLPTLTAAPLGDRTNSVNQILKENIPAGKLTVTVLSNPGRNEFTFLTRASSKEMLHVRVMDVFGRIVETRSGIAANTSFYIGKNFRPGIYLVEVTQGKQRQTMKLIKQ